MIYQCFLDDSKDATQTQMYVCGGFVGKRDEWTSFRLQWDARLQGEGMKYFKSSEYKMLCGEFARFRALPKPEGRNAAKRVRDDLLNIIRNHSNLRWVGVCVPLEEWNTVAQRPEAAGIITHPYRRAIESMFVEVVKRGFRRITWNRNSRVEFVHDDGPDSPELSELYAAFKKLNPKTAKYMIGFSSRDDKVHPPLQAADLAANHTLELGMEWLANGKIVPELSDMKESVGFLVTWREDYARGVLKHELKRRGLAVPSDL